MAGSNEEYFYEVPEEFIEDDFNLTGLSTLVPHYQEAMDLILDIESEDAKVDSSVIERYAALLYGLIHQRYLLTRNGLRVMAQRYSNEQFGVCPRFYCD
ncbi:unnamed protein product [Rhizopus stolonifer]